MLRVEILCVLFGCGGMRRMILFRGKEGIEDGGINILYCSIEEMWILVIIYFFK